MPLSDEDEYFHYEILDYLSDVYSKVLQNLDLIIAVPHRNNDLKWKEVFEININKIKQLKKNISDIKKDKIDLFQNHGLKGMELKFKYELIENTYSKFTKSYQGYDNERGKNQRGIVRRWLMRFLSFMNAYLTSLSSILPIAGAVKEFKEFIENSIGVSQRP